MANLNFSNKVNEAAKRITKPEQMLGVGLLQPFNNTNSSPRKIMYYLHRSQVLQLMKGEKAIVETGYEIRYGDYSSSISTTDKDYQVIAKISKFSFAPNHHYWLILKDLNSNHLVVQERISYHHITESFGYLYNNEEMDKLVPGAIIPKNKIIRKSLSFDKFNNRTDGTNLNVVYMALDDNMEDSVIFSDEAAKKMVSPLIKPVTIMINENDIPLNIYGNDTVYKSFPDIGERIQNGVMLALRKEKKEDSLYMQSVNRLKTPMITDEKYSLHGTVVDVNIYCNNIENLDSLYCGQFKMYYNELRRMSEEFVTLLTPLVSQGFTMDYELKKLFANAKRVLNGDEYIDKKLFSNIKIEIVVLEEKELEVGDKVSNRFGGKGIISSIRPQYLMPRNEYGVYADVIMNSSTMYGRENPGQVFELSETHVGDEILRFIETGVYDEDDSLALIIKYIKLLSPRQGEEFEKWVSKLDIYEKRFLIESILDDQRIGLSIEPMSESVDIDMIRKLYKEFPFAKQNKMFVPIVGSNGEIRVIESRRRMVMAKQYMFRLKQFAEEKFSATSLSATNIKNENTKSKASRDYKELYSNTPIRSGNMETDNMNHIGTEYVVANLMIHSTSPHARRLVEQFSLGDPYETDIKLDSDSKSRSAEILNVYLKAIGLRLRFIKKKKVFVNPIKIHAISFSQDSLTSPIRFIHDEGFDFVKDFEERMRIKRRMPIKISPIKFYDNPPEVTKA